MSKGLVIGKFYPPHKGHKFLIETAQRQVDELAIIVCGKAGQEISPDLRATWMQEIHPEAEVLLLNQDDFDDTNPYAWAEHVLLILGQKPDFMFTSEGYGDEYARLLGAAHVLVDAARQTVPVTATEIRANPMNYLEYLEPCVQSYFMPQIMEEVEL